MPTLGITGGVATGKSRATRLFRDLGAIAFSADEAAREVTAAGSPVLSAIAEAFGADYLRPDGSLDRGRLGRLVFGDPDARHRLEALTHPPILALLRSRMAEAAASSPSGTVIAVEVPLLFEAGVTDWFDRTLVVTASEATQVERQVQRDGLTEEEARRRVAAQMPLDEKARRADFVVRNDGTEADLAAEVHRVWNALQALS